MTRGTRSAIFYALVLLFFIVGAGAVLYAQGWRAKLSPLAFRKVGAIYLRTFPDNARIFLDGEEKERNQGIFERGVLVGNVFPGTHEVRVVKDGYRDWTANLTVDPSRVTAHARLTLVPVAGEAATSTVVEDFTLAGDKLILKTTSTLLAISGELLPGKRLIAGTDNGRLFITATGNAYFWHNLETLASGTLPTAAGGAIAAIPETELFLITSSSSLRTFQPASGATAVLTATTSPNVASAALSSQRIAWAEFDANKNVSRISLFDLLSGNASRDIDAVPGKTRKMAFADRGTVLTLQTDGALYSVSPSEGQRVKIAGKVRDFELSPDKSRIAILEEGGLTVLGGQGESYRFLQLADAKQVTRLVWYKDATHLFLQKADTVFFLGLGDAAFPNLTTAAETARFEYAPAANDLYFIQDRKLMRLEFPE